MEPDDGRWSDGIGYDATIRELERRLVRVEERRAGQSPLVCVSGSNPVVLGCLELSDEAILNSTRIPENE